MCRYLVFMIFATAAVISCESNRRKRTLSPFRNWISYVPPGGNAGIQPLPPSGNAPQLPVPFSYQSPPLRPSPFLPNAEYPIYKIHKYSGFNIKPVPTGEFNQKILITPRTQNQIEAIETLLKTDVTIDQINFIVELASNKDGFRRIMSLIDSGDNKRNVKIVTPRPPPNYGLPPEGSFISSQFQLPQMQPHRPYGLPYTSANTKFRPTESTGFQSFTFQPPLPPSTSYGFPDSSIHRTKWSDQKYKSLNNVLSLKPLPPLPSLPKAHLVQLQTQVNPFTDQRNIFNKEKPAQHVPTSAEAADINENSKFDSFSINHPIVVSFENQTEFKTNGDAGNQ